MGDSDDDQYDRNRRRDKFTRERRDYSEGGGEGGYPGSRSAWPSSRTSNRDYNRDNYGRRDRYGSPRGDQSPPNKRSRRDWEDRYSDHASSTHDRSSTGTTGSDKCPTQPRQMTFKEFLNRLDDEVDENAAIKKYNEYKSDFKKKQIKEFFDKHKDEEWFKLKYHPDERPIIQAEKEELVKRRLEVFKELLASGVIDSTPVDVENSIKIIRILDSAVIKLEGGNELDLESLDLPEEEVKVARTEVSPFSLDTQDNVQAKSSSAEVPAESANEDAPTDNLSTPTDDVKQNGDQVKTESVVDPSSDANGQESKPDDGSPKPRALHKTNSIFLRNLPPTITRAEIVAACGQFPGYLRVAIADPQVERHFYRRGWVTFEKGVNIKEICWEVDKIKFQETACGAIVNRELTRRVRSVNGVVSHKNVVRADLRHAAKMIANLDRQRGLWMDPNEIPSDGLRIKREEEFTEDSRNPLLQNIKEHLIEEANAEEEELLGVEAGELEDGEEGGQSMERDDHLIKILDRMIYYLRIVHSVDYYQATDYPQEDFMPNRLGIMHARGSPPSSKVTSAEINNYIQSFEEKIKPYVDNPPPISDEEAKRLGLLSPDEATDVFIKETINMLKPGKFECKIEGKKFKGEEFVIKHIQTKHDREIQNTRKDAEAFANYIFDPKRPCLPEHPTNRTQSTNSGQQSNPSKSDSPQQGLPPPVGPWGGPPGGYGYGGFGYGMRPQMGYGMGPMGPGFGGGGRGMGGPPFGGGPGGGDHGRGRRVGGYRDLDDIPDY